MLKRSVLSDDVVQQALSVMSAKHRVAQFPRLLEEHFHASFFRDQLSLVRRYLLLGALVFLCYLVSDFLRIPELFEYAVVLRVSFFCLFLFFLWLVRKPKFKPLFYYLAALSGVAANGVVVELGRQATLLENYHYQSGTPIVIMAICTFFKLPFKYVLVAVLLMLANYVFVVGQMGLMPDVILINNYAVLLGISVIGLIAAFQLEQDRRMNFVHRLVLGDERENLQQAKVALEQLTKIDPLTSIHNRLYFEEQLNLEWTYCANNEIPITLMMIDVDHFKSVNDNYGHQVGDQVIRVVAETLEKQVRRSGDFVARYGGEEFVLVCPSMPVDVAAVMAESVRKAIQGLVFEHNSSLVLTASVGAATAIPDSSISRNQLVKRADEALYHGKEQGRNRSILWTGQDGFADQQLSLL